MTGALFLRFSLVLRREAGPSPRSVASSSGFSGMAPGRLGRNGTSCLARVTIRSRAEEIRGVVGSSTTTRAADGGGGGSRLPGFLELGRLSWKNDEREGNGLTNNHT